MKTILTLWEISGGLQLIRSFLLSSILSTFSKDHDYLLANTVLMSFDNNLYNNVLQDVFGLHVSRGGISTILINPGKDWKYAFFQFDNTAKTFFN